MFLQIIFAILLYHPLYQASATISSLQHIFTNPDHISASHRIPTIHESAVQARRILSLSNIATLSTVFPSTPNAPNSVFENWPEGLGGAPIGLIEYYASCDPILHDPTILAISIATSFKNARAGSNITMSLRYHPPIDHAPSEDPYTYSPVNLPRFSLIGHVERLSKQDVGEHGINSCFLTSHPDAKAWAPGNEIHESWWARLVVEEVYWIGGFGDRAYIGWIPIEVYRAVTAEDVNKARLVGEKGWMEKS
ncbi:hypothetical protein MMC22_000273 [Lobaria immixta]|nr:hypothetical protein [Lobaria immixta]